MRSSQKRRSPLPCIPEGSSSPAGEMQNAHPRYQLPKMSWIKHQPWQWANIFSWVKFKLWQLTKIFSVWFLKSRESPSCSPGESTTPVRNMEDTHVGGSYEVFLSFCGQDTRKNLTDFLYRSLEEAGICIFKDDEDHPKGWTIEKLLEQIEQSSISIPIFSRNYASREWCLRELAKMVECRRTKKQEILPIFFDVEPFVVREPSGSYKKALSKHKKKFADENETIQKWENALNEVGSLTGWVLQKDFNGNQGELVNDVVSRVSKLLKKAKLVLPDNIIEMDEPEKQLMELLNIEATDARIVGIHGDSGAGKTVLAKAVYNKIYEHFEKTSFLADIAEMPQKQGLVCLQRQLIREILGGKGYDNIHHVDDGINTISKRFGSKKVLVLLDNVDKKEQLEALAKTPNWFGLGSRIIVTTRNKDVLDTPEVFGSYLCEVMTPKRDHRKLMVNKIEDSAFIDNTNQILASLREGASIIGIYGMGGVGKTTLAKNVYDYLLKDQSPLNKISWATVSEGCSIYNLQAKIAEAISVGLSSEDETLREAELSEAFLSLQKNRDFVIFLDDVWHYFSLEKVGLNDSMKRCRLVLTSRSLDICRRMGCKKCFKVYPLGKVEAWNLFKEKNGCKAMCSPKIEQIARSITEECAGLPLGIITIASSLRGVDDIHEWSDTLRRLTRSKGVQEAMESEVFPVLKLSYDRLRDKQVKKCFLYCAMYPEDIFVSKRELIQLFIDVGLIKEENRQAEIDRGHYILNKLENACLLERIIFGSLKMHDLIREMALRVSRPTFMVKAGQLLTEVPEEDKWSCDLRVVSVMRNEVKEIAISPNCPRLSALSLYGNVSLSRISDCFFIHLAGLRFLDLSGTNIVELPNSVAELIKLNVLLLDFCARLKRIPSLAKLKELRKLSLLQSSITELPVGMQNMANLRCLDVFDCLLTELPVGILPNLSSLQDFRINWPKGDTEVLEKGELACLKKLEFFVVHFGDWNDYKIFTKSLRPIRYYALFDGRGAYGKHLLEAEKGEPVYRYVQLHGWYVPNEDSIVLPKDVQLLDFKYLKCGENLWEMLSRNNVSQLEHLTVSGILRESVLTWNLPTHSCEELQPMTRNAQSYKTFSSLKSLTVIRCRHVKNLLMPAILPYLQNLEVLEVARCKDLQVIIKADESREKHAIMLPKLRELILNNLPALRSISDSLLACESLQKIVLTRCPKLKRIPLYLKSVNGKLSSPSSLTHIKVVGWTHEEAEKWWESLVWEDVECKMALQPFVRFSLTLT